MKHTALALLAALTLPLSVTAAQPAKTANPQVRMTTSLGVIEIQLDAGKAPKTVANFLGYVDKGFYNGTIFHRVIPGFMIQGGGMTAGMKEKPTGAKIQNEADNGLKNLTGTLAMARTSDPHSASAQFFINTVDNAFLDHRGKNPQGWGYAVFGKVTKGMDVVKKIEAVRTGNAGMHQNVPVKDVVITKMETIRGTTPDKAGATNK
jgi:cyclophilin family peptidyl-prolyl cis-trans isomerase